VNYRAGRLEEIPPESREVFANGISVCLAGQQLWITGETSGASADIRVSDLARPGPGRRAPPLMAASGAVAGWAGRSQAWRVRSL
jgi:hypothetical protein